MASLLVARDTPQSILDVFNGIRWTEVSAEQLESITKYLRDTITGRQYPLRNGRESGPKVGKLSVAAGVPQRLLDVSNTIYWPELNALTIKRLAMELKAGATIMKLPK